MSSTRAELISRIDGVRFTPVRLRPGYDMGDVDRLLDQMSEAVSTGVSVDDVVRGAELRVVRWREGYEPAEVDRFVQGLVDAARASAGAPSLAGRPSPPWAAAVRSIRFTPVRGGYDMGEVDRLLERVVLAESEEAAGWIVGSARLTRTGWRTAYAVGEVDAFLGRFGPGPTASRETSVPSVIEEQRGLLARLFSRG